MNPDHADDIFSLEELEAIPILIPVGTSPMDTLDAMNHLSREFGKAWARAAGPRPGPFFIDAWFNWIQLRDLPGAQSLRARWKEGFDEQGILTELRMLRALKQHATELDLYPPIGGKVLDCRFRGRSDSRWIYAEISKRGESKKRIRAQAQLSALALRAHALADGQHGHIGLLRDISDQEYEDVLDWLTAPPSARVTPPDYVRFGITPRTSEDAKAMYDKAWANSSIPRQPEERVTCVAHFDQDSVGTAYMVVNDFDIARYFRQEAEQLQHGVPAVLFLDLSDIHAGLDRCAEFIRTRLQPGINTRVSAAVLYQTFVSENRVQHHGRLVANDNARVPLMQCEVDLIVSAFS